MKYITRHPPLAALIARPWLPFLLLVLAVFTVYGNVYGNAFLFDDDLLITLNDYLRHWDNLGDLLTGSTTAGAHIAGGFYRPVQILLYFLIYQFADGQTHIGFHLLNVALHAANACLGCALGRRLGFRPWPVFFGALLWAVHPLHTEAITYMSGTADPLYVFFTLAALVIMAPGFAPRRIFAVLPLLLLALLSKETAVILPLLAAVCLYLASPQRLKPLTYVRLWPLLLIASVYFYWRVTNPHFDGPATYTRLYELSDFHTLKLYAENPSWRVMTFLASLPAYLGLLVWPVGLHMERSFAIYNSPASWMVAAGFLMLVAALAQIVWGKGRRGLPLSWGLLWFGAAHLPDSGLGVAVNSLFLEHWMYLPTLGLFIGIAQSLAQLLDREKAAALRPYVTALILAAALAFGLRTWDQNRIWYDPVAFYSNIFKFGEESARARNNLALAYMDRHDYVKAIEQFNRAIAITDTYAETRYNMALAILALPPNQQAHLDEAIAQLQKALEIDPHFYRADAALAQIYGYSGDQTKAAYYAGQARLNLGR